MSSEKARRKERFPKPAEESLEAVSTCHHTSTVRVVERCPCRIRGTTMICRTCHGLKRQGSTRWRKQRATPAYGALMMPFLPDNDIPANWCIVPWNASEPPFLLPTVRAAFKPNLVRRRRATFLVYDHPRQFISAKVVYFGENKRGERGYVALTEQGLTVRGWKIVYPLSGGGTETFWGACIFGLQANLARTIANHRQKYPRQVPPRPRSRPERPLSSVEGSSRKKDVTTLEAGRRRSDASERTT